MIQEGLDGVEFVAVNTDAQDLASNLAQQKVNIGLNIAAVQYDCGNRHAEAECGTADGADGIRGGSGLSVVGLSEKIGGLVRLAGSAHGRGRLHSVSGRE